MGDGTLAGDSESANAGREGSSRPTRGQPGCSRADAAGVGSRRLCCATGTAAGMPWTILKGLSRRPTARGAVTSRKLAANFSPAARVLWCRDIVHMRFAYCRPLFKVLVYLRRGVAYNQTYFRIR